MVQIPTPQPMPISLLNTTKKFIKIQVINRITNVRQDNMSNRGTKDNYIHKYKHTEISILQVKVHIDHYKVSLNFIWFKQKHHLKTDYYCNNQIRTWSPQNKTQRGGGSIKLLIKTLSKVKWT